LPRGDVGSNEKTCRVGEQASCTNSHHVVTVAFFTQHLLYYGQYILEFASPVAIDDLAGQRVVASRALLDLPMSLWTQPEMISA
jgi:hypothetical protein